MLNKFMSDIGSKRSMIRELHEFGILRAAKLGADSVFDFSIGDPAIPVPDEVREEISRLAADPNSVHIHGYSSDCGLPEAREAVSRGIKRRFGKDVPPDLIYMTCGAAAGLTISLNALCEEGDEFILLAPYFSEYAVYVASAGGKAVTVPFKENFDVDLDALEAALTPRTKAVIVNSPNNPSGKVYGEPLVKALCALLKRKSAEFGTHIFIISDEPYRELVYGTARPPFIMDHYPDSIVCYSYSKTFSLPGERIGYVAVSPDCHLASDVYHAIRGAARALGYICAPVLFQRVIAACESATPDLSMYEKNRRLMYDGLTAAGFECVPPEGAFYLFVKSPSGSGIELSERARELGILIVPGEAFAAAGYCRVAYCVSEERILSSMPLFKMLKKSYD